MARTYWIKYPRDFNNEYTIGVASTPESAQQYEDEGYERITREKALRKLSWQGDAATEAHVGLTIDGDFIPDNPATYARQLRHA